MNTVSISLPDSHRSFADHLQGRLKAVKVLLQTVHKKLYERYLLSGETTPAVQWFLDNYYLVEQSFEQLERDLPTVFRRRLLRDRTRFSSEQYTKIYALASECLCNRENLFDMEHTVHIVKRYQGNGVLLMAEIWALPAILRQIIVENLAEAVKCLWFTSDQGRFQSGTGRTMSSQQPRKVRPAVPDTARPSEDGREASFSSWKVTKGSEGVASREEQGVINCLRSLRELSNQNWTAFFEAVSHVEEILRLDPARVYPKMDLHTRDRYRRSIEELASAAGWDETEVARKCIALADCAGKRESGRQTDDIGIMPFQHVGYYLIGQGRPILEDALGYTPSWKTRLRKRGRKFAEITYVGAIMLIAAMLSTALGWGMWQTTASLLKTSSAILLALIPITNVATQIVELIGARLVPPRTLPKMDFDNGIPIGFKTMVVIPAIVGSAKEVDFLLDQLERHYLGNPHESIGYALLTDFADAPHQDMPDDHVLLDQLIEGVQVLNGRYCQQNRSPFYLFHRCRTWNPMENCWMGWERKRGKLVQFNLLLSGGETAFDIQVGDLGFLPGTRYVISLDVDTVLPGETARQLIATLAHPLNHAVFDREANRLISGHAILQPRIEIHPASLNRSPFTRMFAGETGLDLYTRAVSDVYQDLFGEGIYVGKGIYEVASFENCLDRKIPENTLISHDLLEGLHGRVGLVTDVVLYEDFPTNYWSFICRWHRWVRGDWQLLPWLFQRVSNRDSDSSPGRLTALGRWKILRNLLRSLHGPALLGLLIAGWLWLPTPAWVWTMIVAAISGSEYFARLVPHLPRTFAGSSDGRFLHTLGNQLGHWIVSLIFLPYEAWVCLRAIASTLMRLFITREHLLEWTTSAQILSSYGNDMEPRFYWQQMLSAQLLSLGVLGLMIRYNPVGIFAVGLLLVGWFISPLVAWWISRPVTSPRLSFSRDDRNFLRNLARRTWLYFELSMGLQTNWLPLDNFQEDPHRAQVTKTSPTNLGFALLSTLAAADLGYIGPRQLATRLNGTFATLDCLPRYKGHFFNWYDIRYCSPALPHFISVVDSGNLSGCLLTLKQGVLDLAKRPVLSRDLWQGLVDTIDVLAEQFAGCSAEEAGFAGDSIAHLRSLALRGRDSPELRGDILNQMVGKEWPRIRNRLIHPGQNAGQGLDSGGRQQITLWTERVDLQLDNLWADARKLAPWLLALGHPPSLFDEVDADSAIANTWKAFRESVLPPPRLVDLSAICTKALTILDDLILLLRTLKGHHRSLQAALRWSRDLRAEIRDAKNSTLDLLGSFRNICDRAENIFREIDFNFLISHERKVFSVGYDLDTESTALASYDLLASEARLASLIAIAKNEVPRAHWVSMGRPVAQANGHTALLSWGGSLFEYLMPMLMTRNVPGSMLDRACQTAIAHHMAAAGPESIPWGRSESCCCQLDTNRGYQYRPFGIKELAVNSGLKEDCVIAPYATALALPFQPRQTIGNLKQLIQLGLLGPYGLYDAIDFTDSRCSSAKQGTVVPIYMTHHQGMIMLSLVNCLKHDIMIRRFHADPRIQTVELLLWETPTAHPNFRVKDRDWQFSEATATNREQKVNRCQVI